MSEVLEKNNNWWDEFCSNKKDNKEFKEIFATIELLKGRGTEELLKKVLNLVKGLNKKKYSEDIEKFYEKLREIIRKDSGYMNQDINWWDKFYIEKETDEELKEILEALDKADIDETEESLKEVVNLVKKLDKDKHKYDIGFLNRRIRI